MNENEENEPTDETEPSAERDPIQDIGLLLRAHLVLAGKLPMPDPLTETEPESE